jgi:hypothetical protein
VAHERGHVDRSPHDSGRIEPLMRYLIVNLLAVAVLASGPGEQTFTGIITDDNCPNANHSRMQMGPTDAECAMACIDVHGAMYGLYDGKNFFALSDQKTPQKFAGRKVDVSGTLDTKTRTIQVNSIAAAK